MLPSSVLILVGWLSLAICHPLNRSNTQDPDELLSRVTRKSVFIAPKIVDAQVTVQCPKGFPSTDRGNCIEIIRPMLKSLDSVLLERLKMIDYEEEEEVPVTPDPLETSTSSATSTTELTSATEGTTQIYSMRYTTEKEENADDEDIFSTTNASTTTTSTTTGSEVSELWTYSTVFETFASRKLLKTKSESSDTQADRPIFATV